MSEGQLGEDYRSCKDIMIRPWAVYRCQEDKTVGLFLTYRKDTTISCECNGY